MVVYEIQKLVGFGFERRLVANRFLNLKLSFKACYLDEFSVAGCWRSEGFVLALNRLLGAALLRREVVVIVIYYKNQDAVSHKLGCSCCSCKPRHTNLC